MSSRFSCSFLSRVVKWLLNRTRPAQSPFCWLAIRIFSFVTTPATRSGTCFQLYGKPTYDLPIWKGRSPSRRLIRTPQTFRSSLVGAILAGRWSRVWWRPASTWWVARTMSLVRRVHYLKVWLCLTRRVLRTAAVVETVRRLADPQSSKKAGCASASYNTLLSSGPWVMQRGQTLQEWPPSKSTPLINRIAVFWRCRADLLGSSPRLMPRSSKEWLTTSLVCDPGSTS